MCSSDLAAMNKGAQMVTIKEQIEFVENLKAHVKESIHSMIAANTYVTRLTMVNSFDEFHTREERDRKMINNVIKPAMALELNMNPAELEAMIVAMHENTTVGIMSTTESDAFDLLYNYDLDDLIDQLKVKQ